METEHTYVRGTTILRIGNPDTLVARFLMWFSAKITPWPDKGEAWCLNCSLNNGRNTVIPANGIKSHLEKHPTEGYVRIVGMNEVEIPE